MNDLFPKTLPEIAIQKEVSDYLLEVVFVVIRINSFAVTIGNRYVKSYLIKNNNSSVGFPDLLAMRGNDFYLFEIKRHDRILGISQKEFIYGRCYRRYDQWQRKKLADMDKY